MTVHRVNKQEFQSSLEHFAWAIRELPIRYFGDPILHSVCQPVGENEFAEESTISIANELIVVLSKFHERTGMGRGLAANQIGYTKRMIGVWFGEAPEVMCNPELVSSEGTGSYYESCISSGALLAGEVIRPWMATFRYTDRNGNAQHLEADERQTRILLHEIDHLDGITCDEKYEPRTMEIATGGKNEILGFEFKRLK